MAYTTHLRSASDSFDRPADTNNYADNDLVANSVTAGSVTPLEFAIGTGDGRGIEIVGATLQKSGTAVTGATFEMYLFEQEPTTAVGDNVAFTSASFTTSGFLGIIVFPQCLLSLMMHERLNTVRVYQSICLVQAHCMD